MSRKLLLTTLSRSLRTVHRALAQRQASDQVLHGSVGGCRLHPSSFAEARSPNAFINPWNGHSPHVRMATQHMPFGKGMPAGMPKRAGADLLRQRAPPQPRVTRGMAHEAKGASEADLLKAQKISLGAGLTAGVFGSIVGVGGGVLIVPMIATACRSIPQRLLSGTSLAAVVSTGIFSTVSYAGASKVDLGAAACICASAVVMAPIGARLTTVINSHNLRRILGYFLIGVSPLIPFKTFLVHQNVITETHASRNLEWPTNERATVLLGVGGVAGLLSGLLGVGGGIIVTPLLALLSGMGQADCVGTSLCAMILPATVGLIQHQALGNVNWGMAAALAIGTAMGGTAGSRLALEAPEGALELAFAAAMLFLGSKMLKR